MPSIYSVKKQIVPGDGDCFLSSVIVSLRNHLYGDLSARSGLFNDSKITTDAIREKLTPLSKTNPLIQCYNRLYKFLDEFEDVSDLRNVQAIETWIVNWFKQRPIKEERNKVKFLQEAMKRMKRHGTFVTECETHVVKDTLIQQNINLVILTPSEFLKDTLLDFGSLEYPIIYVLHNGTNHYDSVLHTKIASSNHKSKGGNRTRRNRKIKVKQNTRKLKFRL